jgi:hypothetical protein
MASRPDRPYSAKSRLESARPLNTSPPVSRLLARSQSQSTADAKIYQSSIARAQALDDSAKTHSSPSKTRSLRHTEARPESAPQRRSVSLSFAILLAVLLLLFWQILGVFILSLSLHSAQQISNQIAVQGKIEQVSAPECARTVYARTIQGEGSTLGSFYCHSCSAHIGLCLHSAIRSTL